MNKSLQKISMSEFNLVHIKTSLIIEIGLVPADLVSQGFVNLPKIFLYSKWWSYVPYQVFRLKMAIVSPTWEFTEMIHAIFEVWLILPFILYEYRLFRKINNNKKNNIINVHSIYLIVCNTIRYMMTLFRLRNCFVLKLIF